MVNFEDSGQYYASEDMVCQSIMLSIDSGLVYDIKDVQGVKIIKKATTVFLAIAREDIKNDGPCFYGEASIFTDIDDNLVWEF